MRFHTIKGLVVRTLALAFFYSLKAGSHSTLAAEPAELTFLKTTAVTFEVDATGALSAVRRNTDGRNYLAAAQPSPLLQVNVAGQWFKPSSAKWNAPANQLTLQFGDHATVVVQAQTKPTHLSLEIVAAQSEAKIAEVWWGPYPTTINRVVGEMVGVVRDTEFAIGIHALNLKTIGGDPVEDSATSSNYSASDANPHDGIQVVINRPVSYRGKTAQPMPWGSQLQAHSKNWEISRVAHAFGDAFPAPILKGETVIGSKIALFGCPEHQALV